MSAQRRDRAYPAPIDWVLIGIILGSVLERIWDKVFP